MKLLLLLLTISGCCTPQKDYFPSDDEMESWAESAWKIRQQLGYAPTPTNTTVTPQQ